MNINNQHDKKQEFGGTKLRVLNKILFYVSCGSGEQALYGKWWQQTSRLQGVLHSLANVWSIPSWFMCLVVAGVGVWTLSVLRTAAYTYTSHWAAQPIVFRGAVPAQICNVILL